MAHTKRSKDTLPRCLPHITGLATARTLKPCSHADFDKPPRPVSLWWPMMASARMLQEAR